MSLAPLEAASSIKAHVFCTAFSRSSHSGSACVTATLMVVEDLESAIAGWKTELKVEKRWCRVEKRCRWKGGSSLMQIPACSTQLRGRVDRHPRWMLTLLICI